MGTISPTQLFDDDTLKYEPLLSVYYEAPGSEQLAEVVASTSLPADVQALILHERPEPSLTCVVSAKVAGIPAKGLWDSGASSRSFLSKGLAVQHGLPVQPCEMSMILADGTLAKIHGKVTANIRIQKYCHTVTFLVSEMLPKFDNILGND
jgi:hypothetical protein